MRPPARRLVRSFFAVTLVGLLSLLGTGVAHAALPPAQLQAVTDDYLYSRSLAEFSSIRAQQPYADQLDWSSDACSWSPDQPIGYDFTSSCHRHDFGYRNYKLQSRFTEENRLRIDNNFRDDMYSVCGSSSTCRGVANIYYAAVRQFGGSSTSTAEALTRANAIEKAELLVARSAAE
ncbi:phospholipase [Marinitenerispora sediminis]|uniref:Phospholipase n=1 Tax=Marinitenerispora sediminis TaxID=1931232 RepID=A0A368T4G3_9ACTN|nr:phospholipase [Marinitenerispora sediminis]RCV53177.1 hypothetical protein DEF28_11085 [Marinitenerispora sediminis]RCV53718.1 hypothetical protein DEF23_17165 [Marinitenerispora sediminis]RCV58041.1 hypothetical protein DEF24_14330 [Marinitenerispora sediminis]